VSGIEEFEMLLKEAGMDSIITRIICAYATCDVGEELSAEAYDAWANKRSRSQEQKDMADAWWQKARAMRATVIDAPFKNKVINKDDEDKTGSVVSINDEVCEVKMTVAPPGVPRVVRLTQPKKKSKKSEKREESSEDDESEEDSDEKSSEDERRPRKKNPNAQKPIIFLDDIDVLQGMSLDRAGRRLQRKQQKIYFTGKPDRFQTTYQLDKKLPDGMSYGGALVILTQGRYPLQCFKTETNYDPSGRKYSQVKDFILKSATPFDNLSDWSLAQGAFRETLVGMNKFEEEGLFRYERYAYNKFKEISNAHQTVTNGKGLAFQKFLIFETEVRNRIEDNDIYEWGDAEVWLEVYND